MISPFSMYYEKPWPPKEYKKTAIEIGHCLYGKTNSHYLYSSLYDSQGAMPYSYAYIL